MELDQVYLDNLDIINLNKIIIILINFINNQIILLIIFIYLYFKN